MSGMKCRNKWYIESIEVQPQSRRIQVVYFNGYDKWVKHYDIEDSCIPSTIEDEEEDR